MRQTVMQFCLATRELERIDKSSADSRKQCRVKVKECKDALASEMRRTNATCIPLQLAPDKTVYARLASKRAAPGVITVERVMAVLEDHTLADAMAQKGLHSLDEAIERQVRDVLAPMSERSVVSLTSTAPRAFTPTASTPAPPTVVELTRAETQLGELRAADKNAKQRFAQIRDATHDAVAVHLQANPSQSMNVTVEDDRGGAYVLQCKRQPLGRLTLKAAMGILRVQLKKHRDRRGIADRPSEVSRVQTEAFLGTLRTELAGEFLQYETRPQPKRTKVVMATSRKSPES